MCDSGRTSRPASWLPAVYALWASQQPAHRPSGVNRLNLTLLIKVRLFLRAYPHVRSKTRWIL